MDESSIKAKVEMVDGVIKAGLEIDIVDAAEEMAKKSDNTIDDALVKLLKAARSNLDWKGMAKEIL